MWPALIAFCIVSSFTTLIPIFLFPRDIVLQVLSVTIAIIATSYVSAVIFYDLKAVKTKAQI
jgi:hypothetical protein